MARVLSLPTAVPTLDELAADPERAASLPAPVLQALLTRCGALHATLVGALTVAAAQNRNDRSGHEQMEDRLLDVTTAAERLSTTPDWLYRHASQLPFTVRAGRLLRFSSHEIDRYIRERKHGA